MLFIADFHIHSHYSRATSRDATPESIYQWAASKGVTLVGSGDITHPAWRAELKEKLEPAEEGFYRLKEEFCPPLRADLNYPVPAAASLEGEAAKPAVRFVLSGEISTIYKQGGRVRKIHHLFLLPSLQAADELSHRLERIGNLHSDGRPILGLDSRHLLEMILEVCPEAIFIPAHIWTPHFSLFGANAGFDSMEECFGDLAGYIYAVETGLSSDPPMNWRLSELDRLALVSNSDAHSPRNLAREANLFDTELAYSAIRRALQERDPDRFRGTLEFFPEEGKYHYDGHRGCQVRWKPSETRAARGLCPVCGRKVTIGVLHRVEELADREEGVRPACARHFESLIPLAEVISAALGAGKSSRQVERCYFSLVRSLGPELAVLQEAPLGEISRIGGALVAEAVRRMRAGEVEVRPGFDGEYGQIVLIRPEERSRIRGQVSLFEEAGEEAAAAQTITVLPLVEMETTPGESPGPAVPAPRPGQEDGAKELIGLNAEQKAVVSAESGPIVVIAGPGTGKTRTLVSRIAYLIGRRGVSPGRITAVTFTNKAATEIRHRVEEMLGGQAGIEALTVGTFHSICLDLLRSGGANATAGPGEDIRFTVLNETDCREILGEVLRESGAVRPAEVTRLHRKISFLKSRGILPTSPEVPAELRSVYLAYQERLADYRGLDYDDLLLEALRRGESGTFSRARFTHLLVDEFQDVNPVQYRLVKLWAGDGGHLFVIGDPHQAIYGFRGADHRFFAKLQEDFPRSQVFNLSLNYRSTLTILRAAQAVVAPQSPTAPGPAALLVATREDGPRILHLEVPGEVAEGIAVVREIGRLVGGATMLQADIQSGEKQGLEARGFSDIAVLFRTGHQGETLEECFLQEGIPYRVVGQESFLETPAVREALAFFRAVGSSEDDFAVFRCLSTGCFRLGLEGMAVLREITRQRERSAWQAVIEPPAGLPEAGKLAAFREAVETYRALAASHPPEHLLARWAAEHNLQDQEPITRLWRVASRFADLPAFLAGLTLAQEADYERPGRNATSPEAVTLMTLHAAKGLEFPVVFITGVEEGLIPLGDASDPAGTEDTVAEERRLFYVGLTRAREEVILVTARQRTRFGKRVDARPSRFLEDIPADCLENRVWANRPKEQGRSSPKYRQPSLF